MCTTIVRTLLLMIRDFFFLSTYSSIHCNDDPSTKDDCIPYMKRKRSLKLKYYFTYTDNTFEQDENCDIDDCDVCLFAQTYCFCCN